MKRMVNFPKHIFLDPLRTLQRLCGLWIPFWAPFSNMWAPLSPSRCILASLGPSSFLLLFLFSGFMLFKVWNWIALEPNQIKINPTPLILILLQSMSASAAATGSSSEALLPPPPPHPKVESIGGEPVDPPPYHQHQQHQDVILGSPSASASTSASPSVKRARRERVCTAKERISRMPPCAAGKRSSIYRGVTRYLALFLCFFAPWIFSQRIILPKKLL